MRAHLATLLDDFRRYDRQIAVVRIRGNRRQATTYADIAHLAGRFAALLKERDIGLGDRVMLWAENSADWVAAFYGIVLRGAIAVPLDAYGTADFATRVATDVTPKLVVGDQALLAKLRGGYSQLAFEDWLSAFPAIEVGPVEGLNRDTPLQILFTSGTTGEPKGIVHTHGNVLASVAPVEDGARPYMRYEKYFHPLRFLHTLPLSHVFGQMMGLWVPAIFAAEVHFESRIVAPRLIETIQRERISVLAAVPRVMALLKMHLELTDPRLAGRVAASQGINPWMRWVRFREVHRRFGVKFWALISGGGALSGPLEQFWNTLGFVVVQGYGMTETTALITLNHPFKVAQGTIGKPLPGREVKIGPDGEVLVRGPMISTATWSGGDLHRRQDEWLATGDLAEKQATGELKFLGRKSEVIVTASGVNIHPEDLEAAIEQQPGVAGCAVVAIETATGPEPYAVLAVRGDDRHAAEAVERANQRLAEFQQVRRWALWPEPDLPRTTTGKVRRRAVAAWVAEVQAVAEGREAPADAGFAPAGDWLLATIAQITGETPHSMGDELRLSEDLHLDSLGKVQLEAALEERLGELPPDGTVDQARTLGDLRRLVGAETTREPEPRGPALWERKVQGPPAPLPLPDLNADATRPELADIPTRTEDIPLRHRETSAVRPEKSTYIYPRWPWWKPVEWIRIAFLEAIAQPLVWFLAAPRLTPKRPLGKGEPMLIVCNHVTAFDGPLVQYALPGAVRRKVAAAMSGEMLEDYRHFRNPERLPGKTRFMPFGPIAYLLVTALFNVFPLPRRRDFQRSFAHAGDALDHGYHVLVFPEGSRSAAGQLAAFRPGIGLLVKQSQTSVLPVAIRGLGELKQRGSGWFRSGKIEVHLGEPLRFSAGETEAAITERLHGEVQRLLTAN
jgi:long-chain acyl-CoA synthetase